jgi:outer membrane receptor protein involved in Fe transport
MRNILRGLLFALVCTAAAGALSLLAAQGKESLKDKGREEKERRPRRDTTAVRTADSTLTAAERDSVAPMTTPPLVGTLEGALDSSRFVASGRFPWLDYTYLGGIVEIFPGIVPRDQQSVGQYNNLTIRGNDWRRVAYLIDGRLLNDPASGVYNLFSMATEYLDRVEVITGPRAFLYGLNGTGGTVNLVTKNFNNNKPFSKINYTETSYNYQYSDGTFSQNLSRRVNLSWGFQHLGADGRYPNSSDDAWTMRGKIRYNVSPHLDIILSEYYTQTQTDLNGGVNFVLSGSTRSFDRLQAALKNTDSYEKLRRHDVDLTIAGALAGDSVSVSSLTLYYSNTFREYRDEENRPLSNGVFIQSDHTSSWMGIKALQTLAGEWQKLSCGGSMEVRQIEGSPNLGRRRNVIGSAWGKEELWPNAPVSVAGYARYDRYLNRDYLGLGGDVTFRPRTDLTVTAGLSSSRRMPGYEELFWQDSTVSRSGTPEAERHVTAEIGLEYRNANTLAIRTAYFHRTVSDPIAILPSSGSFVFPSLSFTQGGRIHTNGIEASASVRAWFLYLEGTGTYLVQSGESAYLPKLTARGGIYYWDTIVEGHLELKAGVRGRYSSSQQGEVFNPEILAYVPNTGARLGAYSTMDLLLMAHIGDAYIHVVWENLTNVQYFSTPYYPGMDRTVRFGIAWELLN